MTRTRCNGRFDALRRDQRGAKGSVQIRLRIVVKVSTPNHRKSDDYEEFVFIKRTN